MYYLETNALRALGGSIGRNKDLLLNSYTSIFSLFELIKGINRSKDSAIRLRILKVLGDVGLRYVDLMPTEMFQAAFGPEIFSFESKLIKERVRDILQNNQVVSEKYDEVVERYEAAAKKFQEKITKSNAVPAPPPETFRLDLSSAFLELESEFPPYLKNLPPDLHPSRIAMERLKQDNIPRLYRQLNPDVNLSNEEILPLYNGCLDLYLFAEFTYGLKRKSLREAASKNDLLDIIHAIYLVNHGDLIVSNDRLFESILPGINIISVDEYKKLI